MALNTLYLQQKQSMTDYFAKTMTSQYDDVLTHATKNIAIPLYKEWEISIGLFLVLCILSSNVREWLSKLSKLGKQSTLEGHNMTLGIHANDGPCRSGYPIRRYYHIHIVTVCFIYFRLTSQHCKLHKKRLLSCGHYVFNFRDIFQSQGTQFDISRLCLLLLVAYV